MTKYDYIITLQKTTYSRAVNWISQLLLLITVVIFSLEFKIKQPLFVEGDGYNLYLITQVLFIPIIVFWWIYCRVLAYKKRKHYYQLALFFAAVGWFMHPGTLLICILYFTAGVLEKAVKTKPHFLFNINEIVLHDFPNKHYDWNQFNNIILKDGLLTLDFKNNKLYQKQIETTETLIKETEFNDFCNERLKAESLV